MTAALFNNQGGNFANVVDQYVYPQFIGYAQRAPSTQDIYTPGTRWQDNSVNPPVQYYTVGAGLWYQTANTAFGVSSVTGTANQITASPTTGNVILSIPVAFAAPGSISATTTVTAGTGITSTTGNIAATAGAVTAGTSVSATTTVTAGTGVTATTGNITASDGNIVRGTAGNKDVYSSVATTTAAGANSAGTVTLVGGTATISTTAVTAASQIRLYRQGIGATGAAALGILTLGTVTAGTSFVIRAVQAADATALQASDVSVIGWEIVN